MQEARSKKGSTFARTSHTLAAMAEQTSMPPSMGAGPSASLLGPPPAVALTASRARLSSSSAFCAGRDAGTRAQAVTHHRPLPMRHDGTMPQEIGTI